MKKTMVTITLIGLSQLTFAHKEVEKSPAIEGCYYADMFYKPGETHHKYKNKSLIL